jgi:hypothetical protein
MKILLQAGHWNTTTTATGAPNEMAFNVDIAFTTAGELRKRGFEVKVTDYNAYKDPEVLGTDFDLCLAIHYDADIYGTGGGFVDFAEPSTDGVTVESQRIAQSIRDNYFITTGIANHPERSNKNTRFYYLWKYLSPKTPCVIIECGVGMHVPDDWQTLHFNRPLVVEGLVKGICSAFNTPYELGGGTSVEGDNAKITELSKKLADEIQANAELRTTIVSLQGDIADAEKRAGLLTDENRTLVAEKERLVLDLRDMDNQYHESETKLQACVSGLVGARDKILRGSSTKILLGELLRRVRNG